MLQEFSPAAHPASVIRTDIGFIRVTKGFGMLVQARPHKPPIRFQR